MKKTVFGMIGIAGALAFLSAFAQETDYIDIPQVGGASITCYVDGVEQPGKHNQQNTRAERLINLKLSYPDSTVTCDETTSWLGVLTAAGRALVQDADAGIVVVEPPAGSSPQHGQTYVISGSGFGTRSDFNDDGNTWEGQDYLSGSMNDFAAFPADGSSKSTFEAALGGFYPKLAGSFVSNASEYGLTQQTGGPSQSGRYGRAEYTVTHGRLTGYSLDPPASQPKPLYASFKLRHPSDAPSAGKIFRRYYAGSHNILIQATNGTGWALTAENSPCTTSPDLEGGGPRPTAQSGPITDDVWHHFEVVSDDGLVFNFYKDGSLIEFDNSVIDPISDVTLGCASSAASGTVDIINMLQDTVSPLGGETTDDYYDLADFFVDYTTKRIVLTDSAVYANRVETEPQVPIAWADDEITIVVNQGAMSTISGKSLWFVDDDGSATLLEQF